jgi:hypothetical protein
MREHKFSQEFFKTLTSTVLLVQKTPELELQLVKGQGLWDKSIELWTDQTNQSSIVFDNSLEQEE